MILKVSHSASYKAGKLPYIKPIAKVFHKLIMCGSEIFKTLPPAAVSSVWFWRQNMDAFAMPSGLDGVVAVCLEKS